MKTTLCVTACAPVMLCASVVCAASEVRLPPADAAVSPPPAAAPAAPAAGTAPSIDFVPLMNLPPFSEKLEGTLKVGFRNRNDFPVLVGIRSGDKGLDFRVASGGAAVVNLPEGEYRYYVIFSVEPNAVYRGDYFRLPAENDLEIELSDRTARRSLKAGGSREAAPRETLTAVTPPKATSPEKAKLDEAFRGCMDAPQAYADACSAQQASDKARMAALADLKAAPAPSPDLKARYDKAVGEEDKAFADTKLALDKWSVAIEQLRAAAEAYRTAGGGKDDAVATAALGAADLQQEEFLKNAAKCQERQAVWEKEKSRSPNP